MESKYFDLTPTWGAILPLLLDVYKDGSSKGHTDAYKELKRMAALADRYVSEHLDVEKIEEKDDV